MVQAVLRALGPIDLRTVGRDPLLRWLALLPPFIGLATRWLLPPLLAQVEAVAGVPLWSAARPILGYALAAVTPLLAGFVVGFLLLDQRDEGTLTALRVTPLPPAAYLAYRLALPTLLSAAATPVVLPLSGLVTLSPGELLLTAVATAPLAPMVALLLATLAENKVQGFALAKAAGVLLLPPLVTLFFTGAWQLWLGVAPTAWPAWLLWRLTGQAAAPGVLDRLPEGVLCLLGLLVQGAWLWGLVRRFQRRP